MCSIADPGEKNAQQDWIGHANESEEVTDDSHVLFAKAAGGPVSERIVLRGMMMHGIRTTVWLIGAVCTAR